MRWTTSLAIGLFLCGVGVVDASRVAHAQWAGPVYEDNRAATAGESYARGYADVVRSAGATNLMNSVAAGNYQDATSKAIDNDLKWTNTYFEMRKTNREARAAEETPALSQQSLERIAREQAPSRATAKDVDPITGGIDWPALLATEPYAAYREQLDRMYAQRAEQGGHIGYDSSAKIQDVCGAMLAELKGRIRDYPATQYLSAKKFVERIQYEARFATG